MHVGQNHHASLHLPGEPYELALGMARAHILTATDLSPGAPGEGDRDGLGWIAVDVSCNARC